MSTAKKERIISIRLGTILSIVYFTQATKFKFVQSALGVQFWCQGVSKKVTRALSRLGLSMSRPTVLSAVDHIGKHHADEIKEWKSKIEARF